MILATHVTPIWWCICVKTQINVQNNSEEINNIRKKVPIQYMKNKSASSDEKNKNEQKTKQ